MSDTALTHLLEPLQAASGKRSKLITRIKQSLKNWRMKVKDKLLLC